tara:strand:+ start:339 stop:1502 length:1164 start_codon:yes stop_codon:yes gene_type:complete
LGVEKLSLVTVIGAGPAGLRCAELIANEGFEVTVLEEHTTVGRPVQCAGLVSETGLSELELGLNQEDYVVNSIYGAKMVSPHNVVLKVRKKKPVAQVIDRFKFDQLLYKRALKAGAKVALGTKLIDITESSLFLEAKGRGELMKSNVVVAADGPNSLVRNTTHPKIGGESFVHGFQYRVEGSFDKKMVELHFGSYAKGFFAWVIPESETIARIGIGAKLGQDIEKRMKVFMQEKKFDVKILSKSSALIPVINPLKQLVGTNTLLLGDAAFQTKATTGGGIVMGLNAAEIAAESVANNLKHNSPLKEYENNIAPVNKELALHWKIRAYLNSLNDHKLDDLFAKAKNAGIEAFLEEHGDMDKPSRFVKKILLKPRLWGLAPTAMRFILG